jgi:hypothetical protein
MMLTCAARAVVGFRRFDFFAIVSPFRWLMAVAINSGWCWRQKLFEIQGSKNFGHQKSLLTSIKP